MPIPSQLGAEDSAHGPPAWLRRHRCRNRTPGPGIPGARSVGIVGAVVADPEAGVEAAVEAAPDVERNRRRRLVDRRRHVGSHRGAAAGHEAQQSDASASEASSCVSPQPVALTRVHTHNWVPPSRGDYNRDARSDRAVIFLQLGVTYLGAAVRLLTVPEASASPLRATSHRRGHEAWSRRSRSSCEFQRQIRCLCGVHDIPIRRPITVDEGCHHGLTVTTG